MQVIDSIDDVDQHEGSLRSQKWMNCLKTPKGGEVGRRMGRTTIQNISWQINAYLPYKFATYFHEMRARGSKAVQSFPIEWRVILFWERRRLPLWEKEETVNIIRTLPALVQAWMRGGTNWDVVAVGWCGVRERQWWGEGNSIVGGILGCVVRSCCSNRYWPCTIVMTMTMNLSRTMTKKMSVATMNGEFYFYLIKLAQIKMELILPWNLALNSIFSKRTRSDLGFKSANPTSLRCAAEEANPAPTSILTG